MLLREVKEILNKRRDTPNACVDDYVDADQEKRYDQERQ